MAEGRAAPMVGREAELARMLAAYRDASNGTPRVVVLGGEAGIGKSRLVAELVAAVGNDGGRALVGACLDLADGGLPLAPLAEVMRSLDPAEVSAAARVRAVPGVAAGTPDEPLVASRLYEGTLALLADLAEQRPLLLAVEDVHWIDRATRDVVTFLVRNLTTERLLLVLTVRTEDLAADLGGWLAEMGRHPRVERIDLGRLERPEVRRQLATILGTDPDRAHVDRIVARSDGNPLVVEELAVADPTEVPAGLRELTTARLARLGADAREVVRVVAVGGRSIDEALVAAAVDRPIGTVRAALREAVEARILRPAAEGPRIEFRHAIVREVAAAELLVGERASLHGRLATILADRPELAEPSPAGAAAELAYHWEAAGDGPRALATAIDAGDAAARVAAWADAARQYDRAIRLAARGIDSPVDLVDLRRRASEAAELDGEITRALTLAETALADVDRDADPERAAWIETRIGYLRWALGDTDASLLAYERAVALLPTTPTPIRARVLGSLANALFGKGRYHDALDAARDAVAAAETVGAGPEEARARNVLGSVQVAIGDVDAGLEELERSGALAAVHGPADMRVIGAYNLAVNLAMAGRLADAERAARAGRDAARAEGFERRYGPDLAALEGDVLTRLGRWDEAHAVLEEAIGRDPDGGRGTVYLVIARARLHGLRGNVEEARAWLEAIEAAAREHLDADVAGYLARSRAEVAVVEGQADEALAICLEGLAPLAGTEDHFVRSPLLVLALSAAADAAEVARAAHDATALAAIRARADPVAADLRALDGDAAPVARALIACGLAEWDRLAGNADPGPWRAAAELLAAVPDPHAAAWARLRAAEATLRRDGIRADVAVELRAAATVAAELGAEPLRRGVEELARRARVDLHPDVTDAPVPAGKARSTTTLSARELEVLRLVADGRTNGEIAEALFITRKTAGVHVTHILDKLGVGNRVEAAMAAGRLGLLDDG